MPAPLHVTTMVNSEWQRTTVPGGWIYCTVRVVEQTGAIAAAAVFVPEPPGWVPVTTDEPTEPQSPDVPSGRILRPGRRF